MPKTGADWWAAKLSGNITRDKQNLNALQELGWQVLILWECEICSGEFKQKLAAFLNDDPVRR